ncbi:MAG: glycosyltransferase family 4 protein [Phycisphaerae bacterium]|nr:glycosyltransferase family 4 protein [Phycisphaerae bacterium]
MAVLAVHHVRVGERTYTGGAEKYLLCAVRALLDAGADVHVGYSGSSIYHELLDSYHPRRFTVENTGWIDERIAGDNRLRASLILDRRRWLRAARADTVFAVQQAGGAAFVASLLAARSLGMRVVTSIRQSPEPLPAHRRRRLFRLIPLPSAWRSRLIWRKRLPALCAHAVIYNSSRVADAFESSYGFPPNRRIVIPNGETDGGFSANQDCIIDTPTRIASIGRVTEAKGADVMLDAFSIVAARHPRASLTYFGDGELIPQLRSRAIQRGLTSRVNFAGFVDSHGAMYDGVDICVQPSRRESMSNAVIEAMARGIPCVVADVGGMREAVIDGETGFVVPRDDASACADAICKLISDRDRYRRFSTAAADRARRDFDLKNAMRRTVRTILGIPE